MHRSQWSMASRNAIAVLGIPINMQGKFLLTLRRDTKNKRFNRKWQLTGGGLEFGESLQECLVREFREEIGVTPKILYPYPQVIVLPSRSKHQRQTVLAGFTVSLKEQQIYPDGKEVLAGKWVTRDQAKKLPCLPNTDIFLAYAQKIHIHIQKNVDRIQFTGEGNSQ